MKIKFQHPFILFLLVALLLSFASVSAQVNYLSFRFIKVHQEREHDELMSGNAGNPWQYRVLADYMLEPLIDLFQNLNINRYKPSAFIFFRFLQNTIIFYAAAYFYKKLGLPTYYALLGITILAWMMSNAYYGSDLSFNTYFDIFFYLMAGIFLLEKQYFWLLPLVALATFNRETIGLIIPLLIAYEIFCQPEKNKNAKFIALGMGILYAGIFFFLRVFFGEQEFLTAFGNYPGFGTLYFNVFNLLSWQRILMTVGIIPFLAIFAFPKWPKTLKVFFWVIVPAWGMIHFLFTVVAETRLFLVPLTLIFIPGVLFGLRENKK